jgi:hypothetical protein
MLSWDVLIGIYTDLRGVLMGMQGCEANGFAQQVHILEPEQNAVPTG